VAVTIRPEHPDDFDAIEAVVADAFDSAQHAQLVRDIRSSEGYWSRAALVAIVDNAVVGHIMISRAELSDGGQSSDVAMLSPLAVSPAHRRQGLGDALVRAACSIVDEHSEPMVLLQGNPTYYGRFGFVPSAEHGITMDLPDWAPIEAAQVLRLTAWTEDFRGRLILPPAFDDLD
jgi:putative acetyltransferase